MFRARVTKIASWKHLGSSTKCMLSNLRAKLTDVVRAHMSAGTVPLFVHVSYKL